MKHSFIIAIIFLQFISSHLQYIDPSYNYDRFMVQFNRTYVGDEKKLHQQIFNRNYAQLLEFAHNGNDVRVHNFLDQNLTVTQGKQFYYSDILNSQPKIQYSSRPVNLKGALFLSPKSFDWRDYGRVTSVKNQGSCSGSSGAFAATAQYESLLAITTNGTLYDLSQQYVIECDNQSSIGNCYSNSYWAAYLIKDKGIPLQSSYSYKENKGDYYTSQNIKICSNQDKIKLSYNPYYFSSNYRKTPQQLQQDLVNEGPIVVSVYDSDPMFQAAGQSGLISCTYNSGSLGYALLVGYNSTHWFIKASRGTNWGHNGFGYISKQKDCGITHVYTMNVNFGFNPTPSVNTTIVITMTDSASNGWNGNVIGIRQNLETIGKFGQTFTYGAFSGPISFSIVGSVICQIYVDKIGNNSQQVGFVVKFENGTLIHNRTAGSAFNSSTIFAKVCPYGECKPPVVKLSLYLNDTYGDGWNGVQIGILQNGTYIDKGVGSNFYSGFFQGPLNFKVVSGVDIQVMCSSLGYFLSYPQQISFTVFNNDNVKIFEMKPGQTMKKGTILGSFCPTANCQISTISVIMRDTAINGWNQTIVGIKQNGVIKATFGNFLRGSTFGPVYFNIPISVQTDVVVLSDGFKSNECGFSIFSNNGTLIYERVPGQVLVNSTILKTFCPTTSCPNNNVTLSITLGDTAGNGYEGSVFGLVQNGDIIGRFGENFTSGSTFGPLSFTINGKIQTKIIALHIGSSSSQISFVIKLSNGSLIYALNNGNTLTLQTVFTNFCVLGNCPPSSSTIIVEMSNNKNLNWGNNIIGFRQNSETINQIGEDVKNKNLYSKTYTKFFTIPGNAITEVFLSAFDKSYSQNSIKISTSNGTLLYTKPDGQNFNLATVFVSFCPLGECPSNSEITYYVTLLSSCNGWEGNVLAVRQNNTIKAIFNLSSGSSRSLQINLERYTPAQVVVQVLGSNTWIVGFQIRTSSGYLILQRKTGSVFYANSILGSFTPSTLNYFLVEEMRNNGEKSEISEIQYGQTIEEARISIQETLSKQAIVVISVVSSFSLLLILILICACLKIKGLLMKMEEKQLEIIKLKVKQSSSIKDTHQKQLSSVMDFSNKELDPVEL